jgi:hypothetical protein
MLPAQKNSRLWLPLLNGGSVVIFGGLSLLFSIFVGIELTGIFVSIALIISGFLELKGRKEVIAGAVEIGFKRMQRAQVILFFAICYYCAIQMIVIDAARVEALMPAMLTDTIRANTNLSLNDTIAMIVSGIRIFYLSVVLSSLFYQGGLYLYYGRHKTNPN